MTTLLIKAARLYDGIDPSTRSNAFVAMEGGRITAIGGVAELGSTGEDSYAEVLDLGDATLLPGLINMHTHMSFSGGGTVFHDATHDGDHVKMLRIVENLRAALVSGVTTIRDCGTLPRLALPVRDAVAAGLLRGPRIVASGAVTTTGGHCFYCATEADSEAQVRQAVRAHVKDGVDFIKLFATGGNLTPGTNSVAPQYTGQELCAATEEARRLGRRTASHAHGTEGVRNSIAARVTTIEHCSFETETGIGWDDELARQVADSDIFVCPTVFRGLAKFENDPGFQFTPAQEKGLAKRKDRLTLTRRLADAGVRLVSGNDAGVTYCDFSDFPQDLVLTSEGCGFSPAYVLASATGLAAEALGRDDIGVLAAGKAADVLAVGGDPLADIAAITRPRLVVAGGRVVARTATGADGMLLC
jgi:imidazolonepropionase-like amidohydrolase